MKTSHSTHVTSVPSPARDGLLARGRSSVALSAIVCAAVGCGGPVDPDASGAPDEGDTRAATQEITNGTQVTNGTNVMARTIVRITSTNFAPDDSSSWGLGCTGTIIGPDHVVTAAHCGPNQTTTVGFFGTETRAVQEVVLYPSALAGHDIAVLRLSASIPPGYTSMALATTVVANDFVFGAGYGQHQPAASGLFWNSSYVASSQGNVIDLRTPFTNPGDSGGPIFRFAGDGLEIAGTLRGGGTYTRMPFYGSWVSSARAALPSAGGSIVFSHSGKCVDVPYGSTVAGVALQQYRCNGGNNQRFVNLASRYGSGMRRFRNAASGLCLDVQGSSVVQKICDSSARTQVWELFNNDYQNPPPLRNLATGQCIDVPSSSTADNVRLQTYACHSGANQRVRLVP